MAGQERWGLVEYGKKCLIVFMRFFAFFFTFFILQLTLVPMSSKKKCESKSRTNFVIRPPPVRVIFGDEEVKI